MVMGATGAALVVLGCAAMDSSLAPSPGGQEAGTPVPDAGSERADFNSDVRVVLVNGLTTHADSGITDYQDVRVCFGSIGAAAPATGVMPLSNYPGVARGRGVDLGAIGVIPAVGSDVYVFDANVVRGKADAKCSALLAAGSGGAPHVTVKLGQSLEVGNRYLLVLNDDAGSMKLFVQPLKETYDGNAEAGTPTPILAQVGTFSSWPKGKFAVQVRDANPTPVTLATGLSVGTVAVASAPITVASPSGYDLRSVAFVPDDVSSVPRELVQSLASIQYVSDPTTDPLSFFDRRQNFVFVAIGDPNDLSALANDGHNPDFKGSGLHILAVPYD